MKKTIKKTKKQLNILLIIISIIVLVVVSLFIIFKLLKIQNYIIKNKQPNSIVTQNSFIITNETGSIKKEVPINPASVGDIKFERPVNITPRPTFTPVIKIIQNEEPNKDNNFDYLFKAINSKDDIYKIDIDAAKFLFDSGRAIFIDARSRAEYNEAHITGAVSIPTNATPEEINDLKNKLKGKILVTYCHGIGCHLSDKVAYKLFDMGYRNIAIFFGGWNKWNEYNYPIEK